MAVRDKYVPEGLIKLLRRDIRGYGTLSTQHQSRMARHVWQHGVWYNQHKNPKWKGFMSITWQELEKDFGRGGFNAINESLHMFDMTPNWYSKQGQTKGYRPTPVVQEVKDRYLKPRKRELTRLIDSEGRALRRLPNSIGAKTINGNDKEVTATAWKNAKILNKIPVDVGTLKALYSHLLHLRDPDTSDDMFAQAQQQDIEWNIKAVGQLLHLANTDVAGQGYIFHRYAEARSGRLYAKGVSLQNTPKVIREAALHGLYDYDFENCHYSIFSQLAGQYDLETPGITHYLNNKKAVREQLSQEVGITSGQAKFCLLANMYGARESAWHENAIPNEIGVDATKVLYSNPLFQTIVSDLDEGRRLILDNWPSSPTKLVNAIGKDIKKTEDPKKKLAHLLQGVEAQALRTVINAMGDDVLLLMHDGFVTSRPIDTNEMERAVEQETGFKMKLAGGVITLPPSLHFDAQ